MYVYIYMYIYICICIYIRMFICIYIYTYIYSCTCMYTNTCMNTFICIGVRRAARSCNACIHTQISCAYYTRAHSVGHLLAAAHVHHVAPTRCSSQPIARRCTCLQREDNDQLVDAPARELWMFQQRASKTH